MEDNMSEDIIKKLSEKLPETAIQRTKGTITKKGYDTDGYGYQYCVDRFNDLLSGDWAFNWEILDVTKGEFRSGQPWFDITVVCRIKIKNYEYRSCAGGHRSSSYADALKGAITNAFKKTAAFWGVGRDAYANTIDDDNLPGVEDEKPKTESKKAPKPVDHNKVPGQDILIKDFFAKLPDPVKEYSKKYKLTAKELYDLCNKHNWCVASIDAAVTMLQEQNNDNN
jgi:hypothetical protein